MISTTTRPSTPLAAKILLATAFLSLATLAALCCRFAYADALVRTATPDALNTAVQIAPSNAEYLFLLARSLEWEGADNRPALLRAAQLNPRSAMIRIRLAQRLERDGDLKGAEQALLQAAESDRTFDPPWALANFYFRTGDNARFWTWIRTAMERSYGDGQALFDLCARAPEGERRALALLPRTPPSLAYESLERYLRYLLGKPGSDQLAATVAMELASAGRSSDRDLLLAACDRFIAVPLPVAARTIWNRLHQHQILPADDASTPNLLFNSRFLHQPANRGFDWRIAGCDGTTVRVSANPPSLTAEFSGLELPECELVSQYVALADSGSYRLSVEYQSEPAVSNGFEWLVCHQADCTPLTASTPRKIDDGWEASTYPLDAAANTMIRIVLQYRRPIGATRFEGVLRLRGARLERN